MSPAMRKPTGIRGLVWRVGGAFRALAGQALPPWDDYWYQRSGVESSSGMAVSPESAMRLSAVFACVRVRSESFATCPPVVFQRLPNGGKRRAPEHPVSKIFLTPNIWQTWIDFCEMMQAHLDLRGNAFAQILPGPNGAIDQLVPLHPDLVQVYRLPNGRLKYGVRSRFDAEVDWFLQDEIFHLRGLSSDGLVGLSPISLQREVVGNGLAMDDYSGRFFMNGARPSGVLEYPGKFKDDSAREKFGESWRQAHVAQNQHKVAVLEDGMKYTAIGVSNQDAQFLEGKKLSREEIAGIYRVPPHKIGILERSTNNNIEHQGIEFVTDCIRGMSVRWESRINADLIEPLEIGDSGEYFIEFLVDGLLRGDLKSRYDAYQVGRNGGWLCPDTICEFEGMNPLPDGKGGQDYLRPINYTVVGAPVAVPAAPPAAGGDDAPNDPPDDSPAPPADNSADPANASLLRAFASESARRVVRKEVAALRKSLARTGSDRAAFCEEVRKFYSEHAALVAQTMCLDPAAAKSYLADNFKLLSEVADQSDRSCVIDWIEDTAPYSLAEMAVPRRKKETVIR